MLLFDRIANAAKAEGASDATVAGLQSAYRVFGDVLHDPDALRARIASRGYRASTTAVQLGRIRTICRLLGLPDPTVGIRQPRRPRADPKPLTDEQVAILLDALRAPYRDWLIAACWAGLRAAEISGLRGSDLELWPSGWKLRIRGKGGTVRTVPAHQRVVEMIGEYGTDDRLWPDTTPHSISRRFREACNRAGCPASIHQGRHTYGTALWRNTRDAFLVQRLMRHSSITSTQAYVEVDEDAAAEAVSGL